MSAGFATDGSLSKTSVADAAGQKTQMASLINAGFVLLTMLLLASLFGNLPSAMLGAVVIDAMIGLITFSELTRYYRVNRPDWLFFMGAMIGILVFGIIQGIAIGVALSLLLLIARVSATAVRPLRRDPSTGSFVPAANDGGLERIPGVLVVRIDGPLFFADASRFREILTELVRQEDRKLKAVVIDADSVQLTDTDGADILIQVARELEDEGTALVSARVQPEVLALWRRGGLGDRNGSGQAYPTVREAVDAISKGGTTTEDGCR